MRQKQKITQIERVWDCLAQFKRCHNALYSFPNGRFPINLLSPPKGPWQSGFSEGKGRGHLKIKTPKCRGKGSWESENGIISFHIPGNPDSRAIGHVYWVTPIRILTGEILQSVNLLSWIAANARLMHAHVFLLSLPFNQGLTQPFITFSPRRRRRRVR